MSAATTAPIVAAQGHALLMVAAVDYYRTHGTLPPWASVPRVNGQAAPAPSAPPPSHHSEVPHPLSYTREVPAPHGRQTHPPRTGVRGTVEA